MTYLELVQMAIQESGAKVDIPSTTVGQTGLEANFVRWTARAWKKIQMERLGYYWRVDRGRTMNLSAGTSEYTLPSDLESVNLRTLTIHLAGNNESGLHFRPSDVYRVEVDRLNRTTGKPQYFTLLPDNQIAFWPEPEQDYVVRYEGVRKIETLSGDADTPSYLHEDYHEAIVWACLMIYAMHYEDSGKMQEAQAEFLPYKKYFEERFSDMPVLDTTALYADYYYLGYF